MNIKTKLENEEIFCVGKNFSSRLSSVNKQGICTVEDFLNCDINRICSNPKQYRILRDVLSCKYLGTMLIRSELLDNVVVKNNQFTRDIVFIMEELGFHGFDKIRGIPLKILDDDRISQIKIIDFLREVSKVDGYSYKPLVDFYIAYYDTKMKSEVNVEYIKKIRDEINLLTRQRDELDVRIQELSNKIEVMRKGNAANGK